jgi:hypothetical protein
MAPKKLDVKNLCNNTFVIVSTNYIDFLTHNLIVVRNMQVKSSNTTLGTRKLNGLI